MKFIFESSKTPVYQRLIYRIAEALNHRASCLIIDEPIRDILKTNQAKNNIDLSDNDVFVITNIHHSLNSADENQNYGFSVVENRCLFIYHDPISHESDQPDQISSWITALIEHKARISHISFEPYDVALLRSLGLNARYHSHIPSLSWIPSLPPESGNSNDLIQFVGHFSPGPSLDDRIVSSSELLAASNLKYTHRGFKIRPMLHLSQESTAVDPLTLATHIIQKLRVFGSISNILRYKTLTSVHPQKVSVTGGIPGLDAGQNQDYFSQSQNLVFESPNWNVETLRSSFRHALININITSASIDYGLTNRVYDILWSGGLPLTDFKEEMQDVFKDFRYIAYQDNDGFKQKINALRNMSPSDRRDLVYALQADAISYTSPSSLAETVMAIIT